MIGAPVVGRGAGLKEALLAVVVATGALAVYAAVADMPPVRSLETATLDLRISLRGARMPNAAVALVLVDDRSLAALGRWPFSRRVFAAAIDRLTEAGARLIAFDLLFSEPEQPVPPSVRAAARAAAARLSEARDASARLSEARDASLRDALNHVADDDPDDAMVAAMQRSGRVLLPFAFGFAPMTEAPTALPDAAAYGRFVPTAQEADFSLHPVSVMPPQEGFAQAAVGLGHVTIAYDRDGAPRYEYLALPYDADFYPSLSVRAVAHYLGVPWTDVGLALGRGVVIGTRLIPTDRAMRLLINYQGPRGTFSTYSFIDVLRGAVAPDALRDRLVLVGAAATGINDTFRTPFSSSPLPGVERMANVINSMLNQDFIERPTTLGMIEPVIVLLLALLGGMAAAHLPTKATVLAGPVPLMVWAALGQVALAHGLWLAMVGPMVALTTAMLAVLLFRYAVVDRDGRRVRAAFRHYLAPALVNALAAHPERLRLGGDIRPMTVLFCDIRDFTHLSENTAPHVLVTVMNRFFTPMTEIIQQHHGTVDKFIGDCIMAFWNAPLDDPDHARHACDAALAMLAEVERLGARLAVDFPELPRIRVGIGLNSGPCCVGNFGSDQRFDYSVLGDTVNLASRIEGLCKVHGLAFLAGAATRALAPELPWREVGECLVRGHTTPVRVHTLDGPDTVAPEDNRTTPQDRRDP